MTATPASADVVIIGGGAVGSAVAYALVNAGADAQSIVIVERDTSFAACSTARSAGGVRQQFSTPENIALSQATLAALRDLKAAFGPDADIAFREQGYLILASESGKGILHSNAAIQRKAGAETIVFGVSELATRFPWLALDGVAAGSFGPTGEGWIDPVLLMTLLRKHAQAKGVRIVHDTVTALPIAAGRVTGVTLASGATIGCKHIVNAAGASAGQVAALAGIALPVEPRKRYVYVIDSKRADNALHRAPLTVDPSGVWFRPEGRYFICGVSPDEADEPLAADLNHIDYAPFEDTVWPGIAARVPAFEEAKLISAWAGFYDYNTLDQNAVIGAHPELRNFYFANGFSGHGLQQAIGAGRAVAELITHGKFQTIDLTRFGYERIARGEPLFELNVI
jgi:FAD-dependent oxidoreductase domain-containing protein 1